ncbi:MAG: hypothetical protein LBL93_03650 [Ruminococcus sp.]|jgi:hypothetical protein|nr:hypothetical protein [Ruminococcus sp.]
MNINPENRSAIRKPIPTKFDEELDPMIYSPENKKRILESIKQYENGQYSVHNTEELEEMLKKYE